MRSSRTRWMSGVGAMLVVGGLVLVSDGGGVGPAAAGGNHHQGNGNLVCNADRTNCWVNQGNGNGGNQNHGNNGNNAGNPLTQILSKLDQIHDDLTGGVLDPGPHCFTIPPNVILRFLTGGDVAGNDPEQVVTFDQAAHQLVAGERLRTILVNSGPNPINAQVSVFDAGGAVVQQQELVVPPGQMVASTYPLLMPEPGPSGLVRTVVAHPRADLANLSVSSVVVAPNGGVTAIARVAFNHNETLVRDAR